MTFWATISTAYMAPNNSIKWANCSSSVPNVPDALDITVIDLSKLPTTLHCGRIDVPMNYEELPCPENQITLGFAMHRPLHPTGVIFL